MESQFAKQIVAHLLGGLHPEPSECVGYFLLGDDSTCHCLSELAFKILSILLDELFGALGHRLCVIWQLVLADNIPNNRLDNAPNVLVVRVAIYVLILAILNQEPTQQFSVFLS